MTFNFRPAKSFTDRHGLFVSLTGGTNSGKTYSALRLARGIAGPSGKIAVIDTEGGRTLHLKEQFEFDAHLMDPPFRPYLFAEASKSAEDAGYDALLIDSFSMEWVGIGGVLDWQTEELDAAVERAKARQDRRSEYSIREAGKMAAWIKPKTAHKAMVYSFLQRRIPIIFAIRGEETVKPGESGERPTKLFKSICSPTFPFEVTVSFRLAADRKGYVDLSDPASWKMEEAHQAIFHDGDRIGEEHGAALAQWACGAPKAGAPESRSAQPRVTLGEWIAAMPARLAKCNTPQDIWAYQATKAYQAALEKTSDAERADMLSHVQAALDRIEAAGSAPAESTDDGWPGPSAEDMRREREAAAA